MLLRGRGTIRVPLKNLGIVFINEVLVNLRGDPLFHLCKLRDTSDVGGSVQICLHNSHKAKHMPYK